MKTIVLFADSSSGSSGSDTAPSTPAPAPTPAQPAGGSIHGPPPAPSLLSPFRSHLGGPTEILILLVVVAVLAAVLFGWALIFRKPSHSHLGRRSGVLHEGESRSSSGGGKRRRRSRHPENRPRNPTLKERGGLPPMREEDPPGNNPSPTGPTS